MASSPPVKKTYEEHKQYLHDIARLMLWHAWNWHHAHPDESFTSVLRNRIDIFRKTDTNPGSMNPKDPDFEAPAWQVLEQALCELRNARANDTDAPGFEQEAFALLRPTIDARSRRDYEERPYVLDYQCGSLRYDYPPEGSRGPARVYFHIANAVQPHSIFDDPEHLPSCLHDLMERSAAEFGAQGLGTQSWLNSHSNWLSYFPPEWQTNLGPEDRNVQWHFGYWGQFINARGTFNARLGRQLRKTGEFPYWPRYSWCTFEALREHLAKILAETEY